MSEETKKETFSERELEEALKLGTVAVGNGNGTIHCLSIIGQIEGHYMLPSDQKATKYEHLIPLIVGIEESDDVKGLLVVLNTMGGDVEAGLAIAELLASMTKPVVTLVLGGGHSIGVPLAVSGKRSFIVPSATMTIHPVRMNGMVVGVPQSFRYFRDMQNRIVDFVCAHSQVEKEKFLELMMCPDQLATDVGSVLDGRAAVEIGLIDEVGGLDRALASLQKMIGNYNAPKE